MNFERVNIPVLSGLAKIWQAGAIASSFSLVAGGCLRDSYFGVAPKDIDMFVGPDFDPNMFRRYLPLKSLDVTHDAIKVAEYRGCFGEAMLQVWAAEWRADKPEIQIMQWQSTPSFEQVLNGFDFDFCQIGFNGAAIHASSAFFSASRSRTATCLLAPDDDRLPSSRNRAGRFKSRYPGWTFVMPPEQDTF